MTSVIESSRVTTKSVPRAIRLRVPGGVSALIAGAVITGSLTVAAPVADTQHINVRSAIPAALPAPLARVVAPTLEAAAPTLDNISLAIDRAVETNPQITPIADAARSLLSARR